MKILVWKEYKVSLRSLWGLIILITLIGYIPTLFIAWEQLKVINNNELISDYLKSCIIFLPAMQIPMIGTIVFQTTLNEDRKSKALQVLVADGIAPEHIWIGKLIASTTIAYGFSVISLLISLLFSRMLFHVWIRFDAISLLVMMLIVPIISFSLLSIIGTIMWSSKQGQSFAGFIPVVSYIGCMYFNMYLMENKSIPNTGLIILLFFISVGIFLVNVMIVKRLNKEYLVNMQI